MKKELSSDFTEQSLFALKRNPPMPSDPHVPNLLSQVGVRNNAFEVPFRGHVSRIAI